MLPSELHLWKARLDDDGWPSADRLPGAERSRAGQMGAAAGKRWVAARWALRGVLGRYLTQAPARVDLRFGERGKPALAASGSSFRFNLSHSGGLALIAVGVGREVGVDVERIGPKPAAFYLAWTQREAIAKCLGTGLWAPLPKAAVTVLNFDSEPGFAAAVAVTGTAVPALRHFTARPAKIGVPRGVGDRP